MSAELQTRIEEGDLHFLDGLVLLGTIASQRWFAGKSRDVLDARVLDAGIAPGGPPILAFGIVEVRYGLQSHDLYHLPLGFRPADEGWKESVIAEPGGWTVYDAIVDPELMRQLVGLMRTSATLQLEQATISFHGSDDLAEPFAIRPMGVEQSNSSVVLDDQFVLKLYRRIEPGVNPELEVLRFLTDRGFPSVASLEGWAAYLGTPLEATLAIAQNYVSGEGDGWELALDALTSGSGDEFVERLHALGEVTGAMHTVLAADGADASFAPEEPSAEALGLLTASVDEQIEELFATLPDVPELEPILGRGEEVREQLRGLSHAGDAGKVIRTHGDYHLGQALWTGETWVILDFEGEPARPIIDRRQKRSPLRDVAGMLRSFAYAASAAELERGVAPPDGWEERARDSFLLGYLAEVDAALIPGGSSFERLLAVFELEKAVYELRYELDNRPTWVRIPVAGIVRLLERAAV
jgi:trehalose synthase-fused probable maltokinase